MLGGSIFGDLMLGGFGLAVCSTAAGLANQPLQGELAPTAGSTVVGGFGASSAPSS